MSYPSDQPLVRGGTLAVPDNYELHDYDTKAPSPSDDISSDDEYATHPSEPFLTQKDEEQTFSDRAHKDEGRSGLDSTAAIFIEDPLQAVKGKQRKQFFIPLIVVILLVVLLGLGIWHRKKLAKYFGSQPHMHQAPNQRGNQKALIAASYVDQNYTWMNEVPMDWDIYRYLSDVRDSNRKNRNKPPLSDRLKGIPVANAKNGREAIAYLTYITDNWANLPPFMVFLHGHDIGWHQPEHAIDKLRALNLAALEEQGWMSIRCSTHFVCGKYGPHNLTKGPNVFYHGKHSGAFEATRALPAWWLWVFGEDDDVTPGELPPQSFGGQGGGQFAVTAERVKKRPFSFYRRLINAIKNDPAVLDKELRAITMQAWDVPNDSDEEMWRPFNKYMIGILFEKSWHRIFGMPDAYCPDPGICYEEWFFGAMHCVQMHPDLKEGMFPYYFVGNCTVNEEAMRKAGEMNAMYLESGS